jgi:hypothetical protein
VSGQSHGDLLEQPAVALQIAERGVRGVTLSLRIGPDESAFRAGVVEYAAGVDATAEQFVQAAWMSETIGCSPLAEPGATAVTFLPKMTEHPQPSAVNCIIRKSCPAE